MSTYCDIAPGHPLHGPYHDTEYGFPSADERVIFERLALEIMQAGLSWEIVLKKRAALNAAFAGFDVDKVARFKDKDVNRLMDDAGIIRNRRKIEAILFNAGQIKAIREENGSFSTWLDSHAGLSKPEWVKLFKKTFRFTGGEIVGEFLMSLGYLGGAHRENCPIYREILKSKPMHARAGRGASKDYFAQKGAE